ncbi:MAG: HIT family protein [Ramlibacter sp.]
MPAGCPLCDGPGGSLVFQGPKFRVIRADEPGFPAFYRVVWSSHVAEFSELPADDRALCMDAVIEVEQCLREHLAPTKVNLAALGNAVPHLHWHVVARFAWDGHYPGSPWSPRVREPAPDAIARIEQKRPVLEADMAQRVAKLPGNRARP